MSLWGCLASEARPWGSARAGPWGPSRGCRRRGSRRRLAPASRVRLHDNALARLGWDKQDAFGPGRAGRRRRAETPPGRAGPRYPCWSEPHHPGGAPRPETRTQRRNDTHGKHRRHRSRHKPNSAGECSKDVSAEEGSGPAQAGHRPVHRRPGPGPGDPHGGLRRRRLRSPATSPRGTTAFAVYQPQLQLAANLAKQKPTRTPTAENDADQRRRDQELSPPTGRSLRPVRARRTTSTSTPTARPATAPVRLGQLPGQPHLGGHRRRSGRRGQRPRGRRERDQDRRRQRRASGDNEANGGEDVRPQRPGLAAGAATRTPRTTSTAATAATSMAPAWPRAAPAVTASPRPTPDGGGGGSTDARGPARGGSGPRASQNSTGGNAGHGDWASAAPPAAAPGPPAALPATAPPAAPAAPAAGRAPPLARPPAGPAGPGNAGVTHRRGRGGAGHRLGDGRGRRDRRGEHRHHHRHRRRRWHGRARRPGRYTGENSARRPWSAARRSTASMPRSPPPATPPPRPAPATTGASTSGTTVSPARPRAPPPARARPTPAARAGRTARPAGQSPSPAP